MVGARQRKYRTSLLVTPHLDFEIVATGHKKRLLQVETDASHGSVVLNELFRQLTGLMVPQLNDAVV